ncbi:hypothetical protein [Pseudoalteromonas sp. NSLLW218]|uniref:hypothetical protein n=1 Tax=Pseudoalteromonas sp. NSLLW218 TaxID=2792048 RepID=UPI0018CD224C|nr:hypothetical protein [Pseudoalteromonas sp. NSLLW218]MBH0087499.1 hypothetical protein [Pseudoalteromonas sp. NSLLW218]
MKNKLTLDINKSIAGVFLIIPFSYSTIAGFRVVLIATLLLFISFLIRGGIVKVTTDFLLFTLNALVVFYLSIYSANHNEFFAFLLFFIFLYWPHFIKGKAINVNNMSRFIKLYAYSALFCSCGVICQSLLYNKFGIEFGKIDTYLNRTGFGFLWLDYSFLSLYLASSIPLIFREKMKFKYFFSLIIIIGSITTTARTGLFALVISMLFLSFAGFFSSLLKAKVKKNDFIMICLAFILISTVVLLWGSYSNRELTISGSGRFEGYLHAFNVFIDSPYLGYSYDVVAYKALFGAVPHNIFLYTMVFSGIMGIFLLLLWFLFIFIRLRFIDSYFKLCLISIFIGLQFIPSFYSGYFIALILSLSILSLEHEKK